MLPGRNQQKRNQHELLWIVCKAIKLNENVLSCYRTFTPKLISVSFQTFQAKQVHSALSETGHCLLNPSVFQSVWDWQIGCRNGQFPHWLTFRHSININHVYLNGGVTAGSRDRDERSKGSRNADAFFLFFFCLWLIHTDFFPPSHL